jgi:hypothetical protein
VSEVYSECNQDIEAESPSFVQRALVMHVVVVVIINQLKMYLLLDSLR